MVVWGAGLGEQIHQQQQLHTLCRHDSPHEHVAAPGYINTKQKRKRKKKNPQEDCAAHTSNNFLLAVRMKFSRYYEL